VALGVSPAPHICGGGHHDPAVRSMKRCGRDARERVAFRSDPVAPTVAVVAADTVDAP
jgi:hypothetical protein